MRIAIVEDDKALLSALGEILTREEDIEVVGRYPSAEAAWQELGGSPCDLVIVDLGLPGMSGLDLIRRIKAHHPLTDVIAFTGSEERETILSVMKAGASGYLVKGLSSLELLKGIRELRRGGAPMSPTVARVVISGLREAGPSDDFLLSRRERQILTGLRDGLSYQEMGDRCHISPGTVHSHVKRIFRKLEASDRREALATAVRRGLI